MHRNLSFAVSALVFAIMLSACEEGPTGTHIDSEMVNVSVASSTDSSKGVMPVGSVMMPVKHRATVTVSRPGADLMEVHLPTDCPDSAIRNAVGHQVPMRQDVWRRDNGTIYTYLTSDEVIRAICLV